MKDVIDESLLQQPSLPEMLSCSVRVLEEKIEGMFSESGERLTHRDIFRGIIYICIPFLKISVTVLPLFLHARFSGLVDGENWEFALAWTQIPKGHGDDSMGCLVLCSGGRVWSWLSSRGGENGNVQGDSAPNVIHAWSHEHGLMDRGGSQYCSLLQREAGITEQKAMTPLERAEKSVENFLDQWLREMVVKVGSTPVIVLEGGGQTWNGLSHQSCSWPEPCAEGQEGCQGFALALPLGIEKRTEFSDAFGIGSAVAKPKMNSL